MKSTTPILDSIYKMAIDFCREGIPRAPCTLHLNYDSFLKLLDETREMRPLLTSKRMSMILVLNKDSLATTATFTVTQVQLDLSLINDGFTIVTVQGDWEIKLYWSDRLRLLHEYRKQVIR